MSCALLLLLQGFYTNYNAGHFTQVWRQRQSCVVCVYAMHWGHPVVVAQPLLMGCSIARMTYAAEWQHLRVPGAAGMCLPSTSFQEVGAY